MEALATKYRPRKFEDVIGQENVITILKNQLINGDNKQGYLFTGGAGTGKTTIARIFAREINKSKEVCEVCGELQFNTPGGISCKNGHGGAGSKIVGGKTDPIEIDAASNNGVDSVREIREACKFKPIGSEYKVYIIDEVHMLSTGAFNALLKTLEEPPAHAVFILCTTDPQKIPPTILSRVQRFDFKRLSVEQIVGRLEYIMSEEGADDWDFNALDYIAKLANGGMRDAISLLDTCLSYQDELTLDGVSNTLGQSSYHNFIALAVYLGNNDKMAIIELIEHLHEQGQDLKHFVRGLLEFIVELKKIEILGTTEYCSAPSVFNRDMMSLLERDLELDKWFKCINELENRIKYERHPKVLIEGWLITL